MAKSTKRRKIIVFSLIGLVLAGLGALAFFRKREAVITVQTEKATRRDITEKVVARTSPTESRKIGRQFSRKSRQLEFTASEKRRGGRKTRNTISGSKWIAGNLDGMAKSRPPSTKTIG